MILTNHSRRRLNIGLQLAALVLILGLMVTTSPRQPTAAPSGVTHLRDAPVADVV